jgi:hypothetical protein
MTPRCLAWPDPSMPSSSGPAHGKRPRSAGGRARWRLGGRPNKVNLPEVGQPPPMAFSGVHPLRGTNRRQPAEGAGTPRESPERYLGRPKSLKTRAGVKCVGVCVPSFLLK